MAVRRTGGLGPTFAAVLALGTMPAQVPVFHGVFPSIGHGGTYNEDNGGAFGVAAVAWLKWQLTNDTSASGKGYFVGAECRLCADAQWRTA